MTPRPIPIDQCVHQLFEAQVERTPDAIAVVFENQQLTYRELNQQANCLAHYLQRLGGTRCSCRHLRAITGNGDRALAILKAGGAYVPLDPAYPQERLAFMLEDAQVSVLLTQAQLVELPQHGAMVVCLDTDWKMLARLQRTLLRVRKTHQWRNRRKPGLCDLHLWLHRQA